jgi:hypothetical protein
MQAASDGSLAAMLLCQRLVDTPAAPLKSSEYWSLLDRVGDPRRCSAWTPKRSRAPGTSTRRWPSAW